MNPVMKNFVIPLLYRKPENAGIATIPPIKPKKMKTNIKGIMALLDFLAPSVFKRALLLATKASFVLVL